MRIDGGTHRLVRPLQTSNQDLQRRNPVHNHQRRVQNPSDETQLINMNTDANFVKTVAPRQFFITRDADEFSIGGHIGCREKTPPRNDPFSERKGWIREGTKIGLGREYQLPSREAQHFFRLESLSGDRSQSWVRISSGLDQFLRNMAEKSQIPDEEENDSPRTGQPRSQELRIESNSQKEFDRPSAKAKLEPSSSSFSQEQIPILERTWRDVEPDAKHHSTPITTSP